MNVYVSGRRQEMRRACRLIEKLVVDLGLQRRDFESIATSLKDSSIYWMCRSELQRADIFIGVYGHNYGWIPEKNTFGSETADGERSILHMEYHWALERQIPMLLFWLSEEDDDGEPVEYPEEFRETDPVRAEKFECFRREIHSNQFVYYFHSLENLRKQAGGALVRMIHRIMFDAEPLDQLVFVSHSSHDDAFADELCERLLAVGLHGWVEHQHILPGADWDAALESALHASDALVVSITPEANRSLVVKAEWSYFAQSGKKIYPILFKGSEIPFRLRLLQYSDFRGDREVAYARLLRAIGVTGSLESGIES
ncbi:MAG: TIR domain-containing protein [Anaerolineae bacterium]|nr:TIR domain-containing protein [Anaerolineae bacterium]